MTDSGSVYQTPASELLAKPDLPDAFLNGPLTREKLRYTGWLALLYLLLTPPHIGVSFMSGIEVGDNFYVNVNRLLTVVDTAIYIFLLFIFKQFVNVRFGFNRADRYISILIGLSVVMAVLSFLMPSDAETFDVPTIGYFVLLVPFGVVSILFGKRLLSINTDFSYLRLYSWSTIVAGVLLATVILFLLALPVGLVSSFALAMIFFTAAGELKAHKDNQPVLPSG